MRRRILAAIALSLMCAAGAVHTAAAADYGASQAQRQVDQPLNNAPVWREARSGEAQFTTIKGVETGVLIQSGGETWRALRNGPITLYGGIMLCLVALAIGIFYKLRGEIRLKEAPSGRHIQRFNAGERVIHWGVAITFCVLALTGLMTLFGKYVVLPLLGHETYSWLAALSKSLHNFIGPLFLVFLVLMFFLFVKDNVWQACDALWIRKAGGLFSGEHVPSHRFNFGEKTWFWFGVFFLGLGVSGSGLVLDFPNFEQGRGIMQIANIIHVVGALVVIALSLGHIYIGTIGMQGAYESMRYGHVDETWIREHHELWYEQHKNEAVPIGSGTQDEQSARVMQGS